MSQQALPTDPATLVELLRQRGLLASGGNIRSIPFAETGAAGGASNANGSGGTSSLDGAAAPSAGIDPNAPQPIDNGDGTYTDPATGERVSAQDAQIRWPALFAGAAGGAMGYAATELLRRRMQQGAGVPLVEGEVLPNDPLAPRPSVDGEYSDVEPSRRIGAPASVLDSPTSASVLADRARTQSLNAPPKQITQASNVSDVSPEEMKKAQAIADELVQRRLLGNADKAGAPKKGLPTGDVNRENLLNTVIRIMRESGALRSAARAIP